ncbi:MAG: hypothetical protein ACRDYV_03710 [Acidimicrobiia bacterium]
MQRRMDEELHIPDEVSASTLDRVFVRTADGWTRRPSNRFFLVSSLVAA